MLDPVVTGGKRWFSAGVEQQLFPFLLRAGLVCERIVEPGHEATAVVGRDARPVCRGSAADDQHAFAAQWPKYFSKTQMICDVEVVLQRHLQHCKPN